MAVYRFSKLARLDLIEIADYTTDTWGVEQSIRYLDGLDECFSRIASTPGIGRPCDAIEAGYRRIEHEKHVIFYRADEDAVFLGRILHQKMLPEKYKLADEDE